MRIKSYSLVALLSTLLCFSMQAQQDFNIYLHAETFTPTADLSLPAQALEDGYYHVIVQFQSLPSKNTHSQIKANGITLGGYLPKNAYYARIPESINTSFLQSINVRAVFPVKNVWKKNRRLSNIPDYAITNGLAELNVSYFKNTDLSVVATALQNHQAQILHINDVSSQFTVKLPIENINNLVNEAVIKWVEPVTPTPSIDNKKSKANHRSNTLSANFLGQRNLQGNGVNIGVWDTNLYPHIDFGTRATGFEYFYTSTRSPDHCNHVVGTIAGAGWLDPDALGMAPEATIYAWNCCTGADPFPYDVDMRNAVINQEIVITNNSYGWPISDDDCDSNVPFDYSGLNANLDQLVRDYPFLTHVYSAGNSQSTCPNPYFSTTWTHKNSYLVAATDVNNNITSFSSFGPMFDGRIAPTISGVGSNVYSTEWDNLYGSKSGTSMSGPGVAGTIAQLYERYKQLYNVFPRADLMKAIVCNTADDKGNIGPDYTYGFGQINALKAVELIESTNWIVDSVQNNTSNITNITVPAGMTELNITLAWTDEPGSPIATKALVNDLDLFLINGNDTIRPWILNMNTPAVAATKGIDDINNIEKITIDSLPAGTYQVVVQGTSVTTANQTYGLAYETVMPRITVTNPFGGEKFVAGKIEYVHWIADGISGNFTVEYSIDSGATWSTIATVPNYLRNIGWTVPNSFTSKALVRVSAGNLSDVSDATFTITAAPNLTIGVDPNSSDCGNEALLSWNSISGASAYEVYRIDSLGPQSLTVTTNTSYQINNLPVFEEFWYSVRAINPSQDVYGERAEAISIIMVPKYDLAVEAIPSPSSSCDLSAQEDITVNITNEGCRTLNIGEQFKLDVFINNSFLFQDTITLSSSFERNEEESFTLSIPTDLSVTNNIYDIRVAVAETEDTILQNNEIIKSITHLPSYSNIPYVESFEANDGYWLVESPNDAPSWEWGVPNNFNINNASNGVSVWATDLNGNYEISEVSSIISPCFDFTSLTSAPYIIYDINYEFGSTVDRASFQYSTNNGSSWTTVGGFLFGSSNGWQTKQHQLSALVGQSNVKFRLLMNADGNNDTDEGIAIDHFRISEVPFFTSTIDLDYDNYLSVYPNPSSGTFNLSIQNMAGEQVTFSVFDAFGKLVTSHQVNISDQEQVIKLDLSPFAKGLYLLQMQSDTEQITKKIILK